MGVTPVDVFASTIDEFVQNAAAIFGAGTLGKTKTRVEFNTRIGSDHKVTHATLTLTINSRTAHWAGPGMSGGKLKPRPDTANMNAITRAESLNRSHEQNHVTTAQSAFDRLKGDIEKRMVGQTMEDASKIAAEMDTALTNACETLHKSEGMINVTRTGAGITVAVSAQGPGGCD